MNIQRRLARDYLNDASLSDYWDVVREAKISNADKAIIDARFVEGLSIGQIAMQFNYSEEKVKAVIQKSYDKIARLIQ